METASQNAHEEDLPSQEEGDGEEGEGEEEEKDTDEERDSEEEDVIEDEKGKPIMKKPAAAAEKTTYLYGYDTDEIRNAYRVAVPDGKREYAARVFHQKDALATDSAWAVWPDGHEHAISQLTVADLKELQKTSKGERSNEPSFSGTHSVSNNLITVNRRPDRGVLYSLYEQGAQRCSVSVHVFGSDENPFSDEAEAAAAAFMIDLAKVYCADEAKVTDLYARRDAKLKMLGLWHCKKNQYRIPPREGRNQRRRRKNRRRRPRRARKKEVSAKQTHR